MKCDTPLLFVTLYPFSKRKSMKMKNNGFCDIIWHGTGASQMGMEKVFGEIMIQRVENNHF
jgi:hypothetical protein